MCAPICFASQLKEDEWIIWPEIYGWSVPFSVADLVSICAHAYR